MMLSEFDSVGYSLVEAVRLLAQHGERVEQVEEVGRGGDGRAEEPRVVRQRRCDDGKIELTVCRPWAAPAEGGCESDEDHPR